MDNTSKYIERRSFMSEELLPEDGGAIYQNNFVLPEQPERYLAIERSSGEIIWALGAETFEALAQAIDVSPTPGVDDVDVWDLETRTAYRLEMKVVAFYRSNERVDVMTAVLPSTDHASSPDFADTAMTTEQPKLPPDPDALNHDRADAAEKVLIGFSEDFGERIEEEDRLELVRDNLADLLANFGHYCDREGLLMADCIARAGTNYNEDTAGTGLQFAGLMS